MKVLSKADKRKIKLRTRKFQHFSVIHEILLTRSLASSKFIATCILTPPYKESVRLGSNLKLLPFVSHRKKNY